MQTYVSLWSADLLNVGADIGRLEEVADGFHIDITDGHLTPQLLFGPDFVAAVRRRTTRRIDVHLMVRLMVRAADVWVPRFVEVGADMVTVHRRSTPDLLCTLAAIRDAGAVPSLAVEVPEPVPDASAPEWLGIDRVLLMGTEIGIKGLDVDPGVYDSIRQAVAARDTLLHRPTVFVDGGIGTTRFRTWLQRVRTGCLEASCLPSTTRRRHRLAARAARRNATRGTAAHRSCWTGRWGTSPLGVPR